MDIMKIMKQAQQFKKMQKEIESMVIEEERNGAKITLTGNGTVKNFSISEELYKKGREATEKAVKETVSACYKKQVEIYKNKAAEMMGGMNLPDMFGK